MNDEELKPWERQPREPNLWFDRFERYRLKGAQRTLLGTVRQEAEESGRLKLPTRVPGSWYTQFYKWRWRQRAEAWDAWRRQMEEQRWERRRRKVREEEWKLADDLIAKAKQMLAMPIVRTVRETSEDGQQVTTIVEPARWRQADVARFVELADKLRRLAAEMETERVNWRAEAESAGIDPDMAYQQAVSAIAAYLAEGAGPADRGRDPGSAADTEVPGD